MSRPSGMIGTRAEELLVRLIVQHLRHARGDGEQRLARASGADEGDSLIRVVQQQVERHRLLQVSRHDAEDGPRRWRTGMSAAAAR
jgi:hypothetical protein